MARKKLDDPDVRTRFFDLIRTGVGRYAAAHAVEVSPQTLAAYAKANADFRDELDEALNASVEPVMLVLRTLALEGDVTAAKEYLKHHAPPPRGEEVKPSTTNVNVTFAAELPADRVARLEELERRAGLRSEQAAIEAARFEADIIDADLVEDGE